MKKVSIIGASGYVGGELLRLLLDHPEVEVQQATSERHVGEYIYQLHPNLRKRTQLQFVTAAEIEACDVLFLALPHGKSQEKIEQFAGLAEKIVDLSADFRLNDPELYQKFYDKPHANPEWLQKFTYGLPELNRENIRSANYVSGVGCNATAANMALYPLVSNDLLDLGKAVIVEIKVGSSEGGASPNSGSHHPERSNVVRTFSAYGHRHTAEVLQQLGLKEVHLTMTSVDLVRGAQATAHAFVKKGVSMKDLWRAYRGWVKEEPFLRLVKDRKGIYRVPEPKILAGSNYVDVGFDLDESSGRVVSISAIDNLMKGAAGTAVQCMNLMCGFEETTGLEFCGLHPI